MTKDHSNNITFDQVHTRKKQIKLKEMMSQVAERILSQTKNSESLDCCPVCNSNSLIHFTEKFGFNLDKCSECSHIFCNPMPSEEQLEIYYNSEMKEFENEFFEESFENRVPIFTKRIEKIKNYISSGKLLDVGSAIGIFIEALKRDASPFHITCCDPSVDACNKLKYRYPDIEIYTTLIENLNNPQAFDLVTMWDTIEHIRDPIALSESISEVLKDDGFWFFSTPNTSSFEWQIAGTEHVQILPPGHINLFNLDSINVLLEKSGFKLVDYFTLNGSLDVSYVQKFLLENSSNSIGEFLQTQIYNEQFASGFSQLLSDCKLAGNIFVIAQKVR
ncbi:class I SAM-dependent methyltransferase [Pseudoalteromonas sp. ZZD1]|uniref:class I SAM-dependent methyltransferase n=1 Tax=Pseudoalteromonas sp. ZZD1 TaxID=3139395 RepID=UPI003BAA1DB1